MKGFAKLAIAALFSISICMVSFAGSCGNRWHNSDCWCYDDDWDDDYWDDDYWYDDYWYDDYRHDNYYYGNIGYVTDVWWKGTVAAWEYDGNYSRFYVKVYRDGSEIATDSVAATRIDLGSYMTRVGYYTFQVRAYYRGEYSQWSGESRAHYAGSGSTSPVINHISEGSGPRSGTGQWLAGQDGSGRWWYRHADGTYTRNNWESIGGKWYYFDGDGWMRMGWINWNGGTYYCGVDGVMLTGHQVIAGTSYHFDASGRLQ